MDDTSKYLIHAAITADGIVERSDVVGAIFGQTEGLLGDELDLRDLQQSSKVGRIDVEIDSEAGQSFGHVTIATSLDRVETSILAASLETITRVGPCRSEIRVTDIEDVREAKRREVVERAKELLADSFDESIMTSAEILEEVRESVRVGDITEYEGLPAGPHVQESDAIVVVEGRADVLTLLKYGIKNAVAVEGTNVPDAVADLTQRRTVTAFLDGDRGGELILRELVQVGNVDYVAFAPESQSVEDLDRSAVMSALRDKVPYETFAMDSRNAASSEGTGPGTDDGGASADGRTEQATEAAGTAEDEGRGPEPAVAETDGAGVVSGQSVEPVPGEVERSVDDEDGTPATDEEGTDAEVDDSAGGAASVSGGAESGEASTRPDAEEAEVDARAEADSAPGGADDTDETDEGTLRGVTREVIDGESGTARLTDEEYRTVETGEAEAAFDLVKDAEETPYAVFVDGEVTQKLLDVAAQRGTEHVVGRSVGEFVKRPVSVRIRTAEQLLGPRPASE
jgi:DNA primase